MGFLLHRTAREWKLLGDKQKGQSSVEMTLLCGSGDLDVEFAHRLRSGGLRILCGDRPKVRQGVR
jgi:hypothetical protein